MCLYDLRTYRSHLSVDYMTVVSEGKEIPDIHNEVRNSENIYIFICENVQG